MEIKLALAFYCLGIRKYMNINLGAQVHFQGLSPMLMGEASPYLSPLCGSLSVIDQNSPDEFVDFQLEQEAPIVIAGEIQIPQEEQSIEIFIVTKEGGAEEKIFRETLELEKEEIQTPSSLDKSSPSNVYSIINFLVLHDQMSEAQLLQRGRSLYDNSSNLQFVFRTLMGKFKKLKKTKEEMIKYCMRKAFKHVSDLRRLNKTPKGKKQKTQKPDCTEKDLVFEMPFRKNSSEKTMNSQFLKHVFSSKEFLLGYSDFLGSISEIIEDDNKGKIAYLTQSIQKILCNNDVKDIEMIKRLPWTKTILVRTEQLARSLVQFASSDEPLEHSNPKLQNIQFS